MIFCIVLLCYIMLCYVIVMLCYLFPSLLLFYSLLLPLPFYSLLSCSPYSYCSTFPTLTAPHSLLLLLHIPYSYCSTFPCPVTHLLTTYHLLLSANIIYHPIRRPITNRHHHPDQPITGSTSTTEASVTPGSYAVCLPIIQHRTV